MQNDKDAVKGEMLTFFIRVGLFLLGLIGFISAGLFTLSKIREGDSVAYYFLVGGIGMCVAAFMTLAAIAGKWEESNC